jgi:hypothetical protein
MHQTVGGRQVSDTLDGSRPVKRSKQNYAALKKAEKPAEPAPVNPQQGFAKQQMTQILSQTLGPEALKKYRDQRERSANSKRGSRSNPRAVSNHSGNSGNIDRIIRKNLRKARVMQE